MYFSVLTCSQDANINKYEISEDFRQYHSPENEDLIEEIEWKITYNLCSITEKSLPKVNNI